MTNASNDKSWCNFTIIDLAFLETELNANTREGLLTVTVMITNFSFNSKMFLIEVNGIIDLSFHIHYSNVLLFRILDFAISISFYINNNLNCHNEHCEIIMKIYLHYSKVFMELEDNLRSK